jgi:hypothetical protein
MTPLQLAVHPSTPDEVRLTARRWAEDRYIPSEVADALAWLAGEAAAYASMHGPRALVVDLSWADPDHAAIKVRWPTGVRADRGSTDLSMPAMTAALLSQLTSDWGVTCVDDTKEVWLTVDVSPSNASVA